MLPYKQHKNEKRENIKFNKIENFMIIDKNIIKYIDVINHITGEMIDDLTKSFIEKYLFKIVDEKYIITKDTIITRDVDNLILLYDHLTDMEFDDKFVYKINKFMYEYLLHTLNCINKKKDTIDEYTAVKYSTMIVLKLTQFIKIQLDTLQEEYYTLMNKPNVEHFSVDNLITDIAIERDFVPIDLDK